MHASNFAPYSTIKITIESFLFFKVLNSKNKMNKKGESFSNIFGRRIAFEQMIGHQTEWKK